VNVFIPPISTATMNADALDRNKSKSGSSDNEGGRPSNEEKGEVVSDKTM
jgi:hypothetical protein